VEELDLRDSLAPLIIIDEICKMDCRSWRLIDNGMLLLGGPRTLVATIALYVESVIQLVEQRPDCRLVTVTRENCDPFPDELAIELQKKLRRRGC